MEKKECSKCGSNENVGLWKTIIDNKDNEIDSSEICQRCYDEMALSFSENRELDKKYPEGWVDCEFHNGPIGKNQIANISYIRPVTQLSTINSEISGSKMICFECLQVRSIYDCDEYVAIDNSVGPHEYNIHLDGIYVEFIVGDDFSIYKPKESKYKGFQ